MDKTIIWNGINLQWAYTDLLSFIRYKVSCSHLAKDILHDAFIRFSVSPSVNKNIEPHAYIRSITKNLIVDTHHQAQRLISLDIENGVNQENLETPVLSAQEVYEVRQRLDMVQQVLDQLPQRCRQVFWLYRIEGYTHVEIAEKLSISKNMVERHVMRAIVDLTRARELIALDTNA